MEILNFIIAELVVPSALDGTPSSFGDTVLVVTNFLLGLAGSLSVIFIIVGGIQYATSAGNEQGIQKAKSTITNAVIGLVIALLAFAIVNFVITNIF